MMTSGSEISKFVNFNFMIKNVSRRGFLKSAAIGSTALATGLPSLSMGAPNSHYKAVPFKLGVASYSLRKFSRKEAIRMTQELGVDHINIKSVHLPHEYLYMYLANDILVFYL